MRRRGGVGVWKWGRLAGKSCWIGGRTKMKGGAVAEKGRLHWARCDGWKGAVWGCITALQWAGLFTRPADLRGRKDPHSSSTAARLDPFVCFSQSSFILKNTQRSPSQHIMTTLFIVFKLVASTFTVLCTLTGLQAIIDPSGFSKQFGIPIPLPSPSKSQSASSASHSTTAAYISLVGARQLGTGLTLLAFISQGKWSAAATVLAVIGVVVAGMDGLYIARSGPGRVGAGVFHALPGGLIALLAASVLLEGGI